MVGGCWWGGLCTASLGIEPSRSGREAAHAAMLRGCGGGVAVMLRCCCGGAGSDLPIEPSRSIGRWARFGCPGVSRKQSRPPIPTRQLRRFPAPAARAPPHSQRIEDRACRRSLEGC
eukprot:354917-Chlamydomonas_euryale.AAC.15